MTATTAPSVGDRAWHVIGLVAIVTFAWSCLAVGARASYSAQTTADEPQYLVTALSLWEDHSLEVTDELAAERYRAFHEVRLPVQTRAVDDSGRLVSPHDPLLPLLLSVPMGLGGWVAAKVTLAALAGLLAGLLVWIAVRRFDVGAMPAGLAVLAFSLAAPLSSYATQVYPELPAALAIAVAVAALTGPLGRGGRWAAGLAIVALPWLGVKYAATAAVLAAIGCVVLVRRGRWARALAFAASLAVAGVAYLLLHRAWYGGWTVYAAGDHFVGGELSVVGVAPDHLGRSRRLVGLLLDRGFGLAAWAPAYLLTVPAMAAVIRRRPPGWVALVAPLAAGWATATWAALTMHGWWWPGRQVVVVLPCLVLAAAWWVGSVEPRARRLLSVLGGIGAVLWAWLVLEAIDHRLTLIVDFERTHNPLYRAWRALLPDYRAVTTSTWVLQALWLAALAGLVWAGWRSVARPHAHPSAPAETSTDPPNNRRSSNRVPV
ncbi:MAG: hypothetical protein ACOYXM_10000 [Actinomycetota bacterium]